MADTFAVYVIEYSPGCFVRFDYGGKPWKQDKYTFTWGIEYATQFPLPHQAKRALQHVPGARIVRVEYAVIKTEYRDIVAR